MCTRALQHQQQHPDDGGAAAVVLLDLESVVAGLERVVTLAAHRAARAEWPDGGRVAGAPGAYAPTMAKLLTAIADDEPADAPCLVRLLSDEGVVGARSTAGREGPVVGRRVRDAGSRPLLVSEVQEHWLTDVRAACLVRWSREAAAEGSSSGSSSGGGGSGGSGGAGGSGVAGGAATAESLQARLRARYLAELAALAEGRQRAAAGAAVGRGSGDSSGSGSGSGSSRSECSSSKEEEEEEEAWAALRARGSVADAIRHSAALSVHVASPLPAGVALEALRRAGLAVCGSGSDDDGDDGDGAAVLLHAGRPLEAAARAAAAQAAAAGAQLHIVVDRAARAERLHAALLPARQVGAAAAAAAAAATASAAASAAGPRTSASSSGGGSSSGSGSVSSSATGGAHAASVHVADWACASAAQRAAAGAWLLPEHRLAADVLGSGASRLVMDGIAWR